MSRIGRQPIIIADGVTLEVTGVMVKASGPKGTLELKLPPGIKMSVEDKDVKFTLNRDPRAQASFGLARTLVANMIKGVSENFEKQLEIQGVGYRAAVAGTTVNLQLGYSHPIEFALPDGVEAKVEKNIITLSGADKYAVGQAAADIRDLRKPEPYKGKGIRYVGEHVRRKAGKAAVKGA